jgi:fused signal recognition particle receptor
MEAPEILVVGAGISAIALGVGFILFRHQPRESQAEAGTGADLKQALGITLGPARQAFLDRVKRLWTSSSSADRRLEGLEQALIEADVGVNVTRELLIKIRNRPSDLNDAEDVRRALRTELRARLTGPSHANAVCHPLVILVAGVNGVGKTTSIGKLASRYVSEGRKVLLVAADTFRAAAGEQLQLWATRVGADCVRHQGGGDPSAVAFDGIKAALARGVDVVIVDTAGRLHVKANLIDELKKVVRVIGRLLQGAPHEVLLVIDATTGQNALNQAKVFQEALSLTGIVLTKLDGTAKGGAVVAITSTLGVPIRYVGYGEDVHDFAPFDADAFVEALLGSSE